MSPTTMSFASNHDHGLKIPYNIVLVIFERLEGLEEWATIAHCALTRCLYQYPRHPQNSHITIDRGSAVHSENRQGVIPTFPVTTLSSTPNSLINAARDALSQGDIDGYHTLMTRSSLAQAFLATGLWFDVTTQGATAAVWMHGDNAFAHSVEPDNGFAEAQPYVIQAIPIVISLGKTINGWRMHQYPAVPTTPEGIAIVKELQARALSAFDSA